MIWVKSTTKPFSNECDIWEAQIDCISDDETWYSKITIYGNTKQEVKETRKKIIKMLNKTEEKQNEICKI